MTHSTTRYVSDNKDGTWFTRCRECDERSPDDAADIGDTLAHDAWHERVGSSAALLEVSVPVRFWRCPDCGQHVRLAAGQTSEYIALEREILKGHRIDPPVIRADLLRLAYQHRRYDGCWSHTGLKTFHAAMGINRELAIASPSPVPTAVYRHFDENGVLLYVGCTSDPDNRSRSHKRGAVWSLWAVDQTVEWHGTRLAGEEAERKAIESERPVFNVTHNDAECRRRQIEYLIARDRLDLLSPATSLTHMSPTQWAARLPRAEDGDHA